MFLAKQTMENNKTTFVTNRTQRLRLLLLLFPFVLMLSSCAISYRLSLGDSKYLDLWWIQELSDHEILAVYAAEDYDGAVKIITYEDHYSPWQRIKGDFTCVDFWTYETSQGIISTIPVVVKTSEFEKYKKGH